MKRLQLTVLLSLFVTGIPGISIAENGDFTTSANDELWLFVLPSPLILIYLLTAILVAVIVFFGSYRLFLKTQVQNGVHPQILGWTLFYLYAGAFLIFMLSILVHQGVLGLGWAAVLAAVFLFSLIVSLIIGKLMKSILIFVALIISVAVFEIVVNL